jgi:predicted nucleic acid-binding protein
MIAIDTSSFIAYLEGDHGKDVGQVEFCLTQNQAVLPPPVLSELLGEPSLSKHVSALIQGLPQLDVMPGFWERVGFLRANLMKKKLRARLADALIAQSCLDHGVPLITRDRDFQNFAKFTDLNLL